jgi:hypothetical protein
MQLRETVLTFPDKIVDSVSDGLVIHVPSSEWLAFSETYNII